jgi:hypothetical protein
VLALSILLAPKTDVMAANSVLLAWPSEGHSGDPIYLSGMGLTPRSQLTILMACPSWYSPHVTDYGNEKLQIGPVTDGSGNFKAFRLEPFQLHVLSSSVCRIYSSDQNRPFGPDIPAFYDIQPTGQPLKPCSVRICARARARPNRVRAGFYETVNVLDGWPGARADVTVTIPGQKAIKLTNPLDIHGQAHLRFPINTAPAASTKATIQVRCRLGPYLGQTKAEFLILH